MEPFLVIMLIAAFGGLLRALLGYERQPKEVEFDARMLLRTIAVQIVIAMFVVFGTSSIFELPVGLPQYFMAFFMAVDVQTMMKSRK